MTSDRKGRMEMEANKLYTTTIALVCRLMQKGALDPHILTDRAVLTDMLLETEDEDTIQSLLVRIPPQFILNALLQIAMSSHYRPETCIIAFIRIQGIGNPSIRDDTLIDIQYTAEYEILRTLAAEMRQTLRKAHHLSEQGVS